MVPTMNHKFLNGFTSPLTPAYVLEHHTPEDVARAMIDSGRQTESFYILNMDEAYRRIQHFKELMPRINIFYAMKSNDTDMMLRLVVALGLGFDCASAGEIYKIRQLKVNPKSIIYAVPCKTASEMEYAQKSGVTHTTFDAAYQLKQIKQYWPNARLLLRFKMDGNAKVKLGMKFGCVFETEAIDLLEEAASLGLNVVGVAFHVGSICFSPESWVIGLRRARTLFDHEEKAGRRMTIVDIGGGFQSDRTDSIDKVSQLINDALEELFPDPRVQVIAEPGCYLSDSAFRLYVSIIGVKRVFQNNIPLNIIHLSNGVYGTMSIMEEWHKLNKYQKSSEKEPDLEEECILWGPSMDSNDRVMSNYNVKLPQCTSDDWLVVEMHGAYTICLATRFSSLPVPAIRTVVSKELWNKIKHSPVFAPTDFIVDTDISAPLPSSLPPGLPTSEFYEHYDNTALNV